MGRDFFMTYLKEKGNVLNMLLEADDVVLDNKQKLKIEKAERAKVKEMAWTRNIVFMAAKRNNYQKIRETPRV